MIEVAAIRLFRKLISQYSRQLLYSSAPYKIHSCIVQIYTDNYTNPLISLLALPSTLNNQLAQCQYQSFAIVLQYFQVQIKVMLSSASLNQKTTNYLIYNLVASLSYFKFQQVPLSQVCDELSFKIQSLFLKDILLPTYSQQACIAPLLSEVYQEANFPFMLQSICPSDLLHQNMFYERIYMKKLLTPSNLAFLLLNFDRLHDEQENLLAYFDILVQLVSLIHKSDSIVRYCFELLVFEIFQFAMIDLDEIFKSWLILIGTEEAYPFFYCHFEDHFIFRKMLFEIQLIFPSFINNFLFYKRLSISIFQYQYLKHRKINQEQQQLLIFVTNSKLIKNIQHEFGRVK